MKAECQRIDAFELWCWRRLLRVPWTARRSNHLILKEISPEYSLEGLMLKLLLLLLLSHFSRVRLFATPRTAAHQAPLPMGFSRQDYWSGLHALLQGVFLIHLCILHLLHWQVGSLPLSQEALYSSVISVINLQDVLVFFLQLFRQNKPSPPTSQLGQPVCCLSD